ncbi:2-hydroxyacid dehydrogenase [Hellea balneolensis]|uniref:2-hydroxyacid dehydrogenase n=1 Tax=Hellea balneolensis TaxID=287478 RepID=UPI000427991B|nr:glyoxylate/hydroxypyruvate reductase A [Hellea balneolensis]
MTILLNNDGHWHARWRAAIETHMPGRAVVEFPDITNRASIDYALIWKHPPGDLEKYPNLKAVFSLGSGVDYLDAFPTLPEAPIFRLIDTNMAEDMALYTLYWTIHFQRLFGTYQTQQKQAKWARYPTPLAPDFKVSILGLGAIGSHIAKALARNGFDVSGWARSPKDITGVKCVYGKDALETILPKADVLICCLPFTKATYMSLDLAVLSKMKKGGAFINISRGAVVNEADLLTLLDSGHIGGAALDVFHAEPLPENSPFWSHPDVHVTPHMSGATNPDTAVQIISKEITDFENGIMPPYPYMREATCSREVKA